MGCMVSASVQPYSPDLIRLNGISSDCITSDSDETKQAVF